MEKRKRIHLLLLVICILAASVFGNMFSGRMTVYAKTSQNIRSVSVRIGKKNVTKKTVKLEQGKTAKLVVSTKPVKAKKSVKYSSNKKNIATVSKSGKIKAKKPGTAKIKIVVSGKSKKKTTYVKIKVTKKSKEDQQKPSPEPTVPDKPEPTPEPSTPDEPESTPEPSTPDEPSKGKVLVAYFSRTGENYGVGVIEKGNTAIIADMIAEQTGGMKFEVVTVNAYPDVYSECTAVARQEQEENARPALKGGLPVLDEYETVFIGYPIWWSDMPMAVYTFLESYDWNGKTVIPFCTHAGSGMSGTEVRIRTVCTGADVKSGLAIPGTTAQNNQDAAKESVSVWLDGMGFKLWRGSR